MENSSQEYLHGLPFLNRFHCQCCRFRGQSDQFYRPFIMQNMVFSGTNYYQTPQPHIPVQQISSSQKLLSPSLKLQQNIQVLQSNIRVQNNACNFKPKQNRIDEQKKIKTYRTKDESLPSVRYKAKYFDPSTSPLMTSSQYARIQKLKFQKTLKKNSKTHHQHIDEILEGQKDGDPFIVFKFRRIKKKYKKYLEVRGIIVKQETQNYNSSEQSQDEQIGSDNLSQLSKKSENFQKQQKKKKQQKIFEVIKNYRSNKINQEEGKIIQ